MPILPRSAPRRGLSPFPLPFVCQSCRRSQRQFSVTSRRASATATAPPPPPSSGYALLTSRRLISLAGPDAPKFLQGLITQPVIDEPTIGAVRHRLHASSTASRTSLAAGAPGFYSAFLNATGRVLHDVFVYRDTLGISAGAGAADGGNAFVVEVDAGQVDTLAHHIKRYKLRSKLEFRVLDEGEVAAWQVWDGSSSSPSLPEQSPLSRLKDSIVLPDTRAPGMGYRVLRRGGGGADDGLDLDLARSDDDAYRVRRYLLGVPEGQAEIPREHALPLESNMDLMGGIDFRKGCYVGQELTIRTRHRGVIRKRILPCLLYPASGPGSSSNPEKLEYAPYIAAGEEGEGQGEGENEKKQQQHLSAADVPSNLSIGRERVKGRSAGTWLRGVGNVGLALCRLQIMTDVELPGETAARAPYDPARDEFVVKWGEDEEGNGGQAVKLTAFVPDWMRERLPMW
ncbi:Aminomethyltransferase folate-binding domain-containing protein [Daldinia caldariorum]|uniref:Aminomethyltransferase folate-binding domain-containing protein n=1 Tax=Daldinia caldariorum TaxID=326644 RepID=UPI00200774CF|nr:Aminomethyltransferase folate-binding domain-containing protein [Daldinia caldariorum]KAI1469447.1 Aminomethyltransferase folate-binding domain-containing protein [Daldinia caldariorum]